MSHVATAGLMVFLGLLGQASRGAAELQSIAPEQFEELHRLIKPAVGESRWMEIEWHPNIWEARQKAAKEGKPLFIWAGSGGAPAAGC